MPRLVIESHSEERTAAVGAALAAVLRPGDFLALHGELGAGKTAMVRGIAQGLGIEPSVVSSPTFVVAHEYEPEFVRAGGSGTMPLWHIDAYRLMGTDELESIGWDVVTDGRGAVVVEWAERIEDALPRPGDDRRGDARLSHAGESARRIELTLPGAWAGREGWGAVAALAEGARGRLPEGWVRCPITRRPVAPDSPTFPFFDERARMADLGKWLSGEYTVSRELTEEDLDDPEIGP